MKAYRNNWYYIGGIIFAVLAIVLGLFGDMIDPMRRIMMHGLMNKKMGTLYNPGVGTALFVLVPVGIYSLWYIAVNYDIPAWNWWVPILFFPFVVFLTILLPILKCQSKESPYVLPERDTKGFSIKGKTARIRR